MKLLVACALIGLVAGKAVETPSPLFPGYDYHRDVGIPMAARIKAAEEAQDFDGSRIVGGSPAFIGQFPYLGGLIITLTTGSQSVCGSSLLTNTRGLTAAHCWRTDGMQAVEFMMVLGSTQLFFGGTRVVTRDVETHANYDTTFVYNDIAIMRLPWVTFNANIQPIAFASGTQTYAGTWATVAGFGLTADGSTISSSQSLSHVDVQVITNAACANVFSTLLIIDSTLCVATTGGQGPCTSDSGGPLVVNNQQIGVVSFGTARCQGGQPSAFARVTSFAEWISARL